MNVLVVSPHPDDETLGAGGTLLKLKKQGNKIFWLNITNMSKEYGWSEDKINHRLEQIELVKKEYKFDGFYDLALLPAGLTTVGEGEIIGKIRAVIEQVKPEWVMLPGQYDAHSDHHVVYNCCMACLKSFRAPYVKRIITMEIISETEFGYQNEVFSPNFYVDITDELEKKIEIMKLYDTELENVPFPRSVENIKAVARYRGSSCFVKYAEAFRIVKQIE